MIYIIRQVGLYESNINPSLVFTFNCKMGYLYLRWLDTVFQGQYLKRWSINSVARNKDFEKLPSQLY